MKGLDLIRETPRTLGYSSKRSSYEILEYSGATCRKCNSQMSIRAYFEKGETDFSVSKCLKHTILCNCKMKVMLRNGVVFYEELSGAVKRPLAKLKNGPSVIPTGGSKK